MTKKISTRAINKLISDAYSRLLWATESDSRASGWVTEAVQLAGKGERRHRGSVASKYTVSVAYAAQYFVCRNAAAGPKRPLVAWDEVAELRDDVRLSYAIHQRMQRLANDPGSSERQSDQWSAFKIYAGEMDARVDYVTDIANND